MAINVNYAVYGTQKKGIDVTSICQNLIANGNDDITVNNQNFTDPDPGNQKSFGIRFTNNDNIYEMACVEGTNLDVAPLPSPIVPPTPTFAVVNAIYGTPSGASVDVTPICQALFNSGSTTITPSNSMFGVDPSYGNKKYFSIVYTSVGDSTRYYRACPESVSLTLTAS